MKLGLVYHQFVNAGGLEKYLVDFTKGLIARGHSIDVVTSKTDDSTANLDGVRYRVLRRRPVSSMLRLWDFAARAQGLCKPDSEFRRAMDLTIGFGRTITHDLHRAGGGCHSVYSRLLPAPKRWGMKNRLELSLEWQLYTSGKTRHFVVNASKVMDELVSSYNAEPNNFTVIHTAVDSARYRPCADQDERSGIRAEMGLSDIHRIVLFVSSSHRRKGLGALIRALAKAPLHESLRLWIVGEPMDSRHGQMIAAVPGLPERVHWLGKRDDLDRLYRAADVFVHPTLYDACANTVLQAMASGAPAIVSSADGAREFVTHQRNGYLLQDPTDHDELHHHLRDLLHLPQADRKSMGEAARARMLPLTRDAHIDRWERLFELLTSRSSEA